MTDQQAALAVLVIAAALLLNEARRSGSRVGIPALGVSALVAGTAYAIKRLR